MEVEGKDTQLREKVTQIDRQQREIQALRVGIHSTLEALNKLENVEHCGVEPEQAATMATQE